MTVWIVSSRKTNPVDQYWTFVTDKFLFGSTNHDRIIMRLEESKNEK